MKKTLSVIALLLSLVTILSFGSVSAFAAESSEASEVENSVMIPLESSEDATTEDATSEDATSEEATSEETTSEEATSEDASSEDSTSEDATSEESSEESSKADAATDDDGDKGSTFPWALVIFLGVVVVAVIVCFICIKQENKFGIWLKNFFRDYKSELKKITWPSREVTVKSTIVVLVCVLVCAAVIGLFDFGLGKLVEFLMDLVSGK